MNIAIILAAGQSRRLGKIYPPKFCKIKLRRVNKIFYQIKGKPLIFYPILTFEKNSQIKKIILVARKKDFRKLTSLIKKYKFKKIAKIVEGGKERQDSAYEGVKAAKNLGTKKGDLILFHNGANPLVSQKEINQVIKEARKYGAALVAQPLKDTLKMADKLSFAKTTIPRQNLWLAQTPQAIEYNLALKAFKKAKKDKFLGSDDVSLVERLGEKVKIVTASSRNIKVTDPEDLKIVKSLLKDR